MPLNALAELILQPVIELIAHVFGYLTGWLVVPVVTLGMFRVERLLEDDKSRPTLRDFPGEVPGARVISADAGTAIGFLFWVLVAVAVYFLKFHG